MTLSGIFSFQLDLTPKWRPFDLTYQGGGQITRYLPIVVESNDTKMVVEVSGVIVLYHHRVLFQDWISEKTVCMVRDFRIFNIHGPKSGWKITRRRQDYLDSTDY